MYEMRCDMCDKEQVIDKKLSNKNWTVYKHKGYTQCTCGGTFVIKLKKK